VFSILLSSCKPAAVPATEETAAVTETAKAEETTEETVQGPITINAWCLAGQQNTNWQQWKALYEKEHPNVTINVTAQEPDTMGDIITSALAAGEKNLDITFYWGGASVDQWGRDGLLLDLTKYFEENGWWDKKNEGAKVFVTEGAGIFYFTTNWVTVPHYYYNPAIFKEVGVEPPETLDDIFTISAKIKNAGYAPWAVGVVTRWPVGSIFNDVLARFMSREDMSKFVNWERDSNRSVESAEILRSEDAIKAWAFLEKMIKEGIFIEGANAMDDTASRQAWLNGKAAIYNSGSWSLDYFKTEVPDFEYDYFNLPAVDGRRSICSFYDGLIIPSSVSEEKIPILIDFLNSTFEKEYALSLMKVGYIPDNKTVSDEDLKAVANPVLLRLISDVREYGEVGIIDSLQSPKLRQGYYDLIGEFFEGKLTPEEAAQRMYDNAVASLEE
jgi:raffinose/stachyose/melibiose transport system substrate-binding protein